MSRIARYFNRFGSPKICEDLSACGSAQEIHPPLLEEASSAAILDPRVSRQFELRRGDLALPQTLHRIPGARILGPHGVVLLPDGRFVLQGQWDRSFLEQDPIYHHFSRAGGTYLSGPTYCLMSRWGDSYYHWLHDVLPRLLTALPHLPAETSFLLNEHPKDYQIESLKAYGIHGDNLQPCLGPCARIQVETLWFATPLGNPEFSSSKMIRKTGGMIRDACHPNGHHSPPADFIFISRSKCSRRRLLNEDAVFGELEGLGFQRFFFEELPFCEQVNCAANAKVLCGLHGAGFTNMMFSHSRQKIIEIMSPARDQIHYMLLAHKMGHAHFSYDSVKEVAGTSECDYLIDPQHFSSFVRQCLEKK